MSKSDLLFEMKPQGIVMACNKSGNLTLQSDGDYYDDKIIGGKSKRMLLFCMFCCFLGFCFAFSYRS